MTSLENEHLAHLQMLLGSGSRSHQASEFIPQLYYSLYQLKKDPNSTSNSLKTATSSIRHRLKQCKAYIEQNGECQELLGRSCSEWEKTLAQRERELEVKRQLLKDLQERVSKLSPA
ncbi:LAMI_0C01860g1_1 [Lachancea mirantina]|uniref:Mediator of RNA polymerase II transcription subunit 9 n=1 Tax=Lachancea mirantina TaxID=1230905 RepID=A0A1G4J0H2_9SACH|nr:LAMI_0C01860g1_1 [Lachancea mirantina]